MKINYFTGYPKQVIYENPDIFFDVKVIPRINFLLESLGLPLLKSDIVEQLICNDAFTFDEIPYVIEFFENSIQIIANSKLEVANKSELVNSLAKVIFDKYGFICGCYHGDPNTNWGGLRSGAYSAFKSSLLHTIENMPREARSEIRNLYFKTFDPNSFKKYHLIYWLDQNHNHPLMTLATVVLTSMAIFIASRMTQQTTKP